MQIRRGGNLVQQNTLRVMSPATYHAGFIMATDATDSSSQTCCIHFQSLNEDNLVIPLTEKNFLRVTECSERWWHLQCPIGDIARAFHDEYRDCLGSFQDAQDAGVCFHSKCYSRCTDIRR